MKGDNSMTAYEIATKYELKDKQVWIVDGGVKLLSELGNPAYIQIIISSSGMTAIWRNDADISEAGRLIEIAARIIENELAE